MPPADVEAYEHRQTAFFRRIPWWTLTTWAVLVGVLWLLSDFFAIIFLTFIFSYVAKNIVGALEHRIPYRRTLVVGVFLGFLGLMAATGAWLAPKLYSEGKSFYDDFRRRLVVAQARAAEEAQRATEEAGKKPEPAAPDGHDGTGSAPPPSGEDGKAGETDAAAGTPAGPGGTETPKARGEVPESGGRVETGGGERPAPPALGAPIPDKEKPPPPGATIDKTLDEFLKGVVGKERYDKHLAEAGWYRDLKRQAIEKTPQWTTEMLEILKRLAQGVLRGVFTFLVSLLFSFLIVLDMPRFRLKVAALRETRLRDFFDEIAPALSHFGDLMGRAFQAQIMIAIVNTILTFIGMTILKIPNTAVLSTIVFLCSFIPVLGVFISSAPIVLVCLNQEHGLSLSLWAIGMVLIAHTIEAYVLNPRLMGARLKIHPLLALVILLVGEHLAGVWGLLIGLPLCAYLFDVIRGPLPVPGPPSAPAPAPAAPAAVH